jgi:hypothetical protein
MVALQSSLASSHAPLVSTGNYAKKKIHSNHALVQLNHAPDFSSRSLGETFHISDTGAKWYPFGHSAAKLASITDAVAKTKVQSFFMAMLMVAASYCCTCTCCTH